VQDDGESGYEENAAGDSAATGRSIFACGRGSDNDLLVGPGPRKAASLAVTDSIGLVKAWLKRDHISAFVKNVFALLRRHRVGLVTEVARD